MLKKSLFAVAAVMLLAVMANAGEIKIHDWPTTYVPQEVCDIPVVMDIGFWINVRDQGDLVIELEQLGIREYEGCETITIDCNFDLTLSSSIVAEPVGDPYLPDADYSTWINGADIDAGVGRTAEVCARVELGDLGLGETTAGASGVQVATVTVKVVPR